MNKVAQIILTYLETDRINYALMINGAWGSGKTHYLKESLKATIEDKTKKKLLYISLNGISSIEDIGNRLLGEKFKMWSDGKNDLVVKGIKAAKFATTALLNVVKFKMGFDPTEGADSTDLKDFLMDFSNHILCFDDLERISPKIGIEEVLGYINTEFVEHNHIKTLIISDESRIEQSDKYKTYKEKLIGRTVTFEWNITEKIEVLFNAYHSNKEFHSFIANEKEYITDIITNFKEDNLRILFFYFDSLEHIVSKLTENDRNKLGKSIIIFTLILCINYKRKGILYEEEIYKQNLSYRINSNKLEELSEDDKALLDFYKQFSIYFNDYKRTYFSSIYFYIKDGFLDEDKLKEEIVEIINRNRSLSPEELCLEKLVKVRTLSAEQFDDNITAIFRYLDKGKYDLYMIMDKVLPHIYFGFANGLINKFASVEELIDYFKAKMLEVKHNTKYVPKPLFRNVNAELKDIYLFAQSLHEEIEKAYKIQFTQNRLIEVKRTPNLLAFNSDYYGFLRGMLQYISYDEILEFILEVTLDGEAIIKHILESDYLRVSNAGQHYYEGKPILERLAQDIKIEASKPQYDKIKKFTLMEVVESLNKAVIHLDKTK